MDYTVEREDKEYRGYKYNGFIDGQVAGYVVGFERKLDIFDIQHSELEVPFRGTVAVRAFSEIIKAVEKDYKYIISRIDSEDNAEVKIVLGAGFRIIGTMAIGNKVSIELLKVREGN